MTIKRRHFLVSAVWTSVVLIGGGLVAWLADRYRTAAGNSTRRAGGGPRFQYDLNQYAHTDPSLILYDEIEPIASGMRDAVALAAGPDDAVYVAGDTMIKVFDPSGRGRTSIVLKDDPHALCVDAQGRVVVAFKDHIQILDPRGRVLADQPSLGPRAWLTSVAVAGDDVFIADGGNRQVLRCDADARILNTLGGKEADSSHPGFVVPSPFFDVETTPDGTVMVANPGRHRIETFSPDGRYHGGWGRASMAVDGFCGCCNPANFAVLVDGRCVTSEKGLNRIKVYSRHGTLDGVVAGPEHLIRDTKLAAQACRDCTVGFGIPVAADARGRILALDPMTRSVRVFASRAA